MANTYRKMYLQIVFAVKYRRALLDKSWRAEVFKYIAGTINNRGHYSLAVNGVADHLHIYFDYSGKELLEDLVREIKKSSNAFIKDNQFTSRPFKWQSGYAVFSHSHHEKDKMIRYVLNQERHHEKINFRKEYLKLLKEYEIDFEEAYIFDFLK